MRRILFGLIGLLLSASPLSAAPISFDPASATPESVLTEILRLSPAQTAQDAARGHLHKAVESFRKQAFDETAGWQC